MEWTQFSYEVRCFFGYSLFCHDESSLTGRLTAVLPLILSKIECVADEAFPFANSRDGHYRSLPENMINAERILTLLINKQYLQ